MKKTANKPAREQEACHSPAQVEDLPLLPPDWGRDLVAAGLLPTAGAALTAAGGATPTGACAADARGIVGVCAAVAQGMLKSMAPGMLPGMAQGMDPGLGSPPMGGNCAGPGPIMVDRYAIMVGSMPAGAGGAEL